MTQKEKETFNTIIIQINSINHKAYLKNSAQVLQLKIICPTCKQVLVKNGFYPRKIRIKQALVSTFIYRKCCSPCNLSFSLLPHFLLPRFRYRANLIQLWLWQHLFKGNLTLQFLFKLFYPSLKPTCASAPTQSLSDLIDTAELYPSRALLRYWLNSFEYRAKKKLPQLITYAIITKINFSHLSSFYQFKSKALNALPLALALSGLLFPDLCAGRLCKNLLFFLLGP